MMKIIKKIIQDYSKQIENPKKSKFLQKPKGPPPEILER